MAPEKIQNGVLYSCVLGTPDLNSPTNTGENEPEISDFPQLKTLGSDSFTGKFYQTVKFQIIPILHKILWRSEKGR